MAAVLASTLFLVEPADDTIWLLGDYVVLLLLIKVCSKYNSFTASFNNILISNGVYDRWVRQLSVALGCI